MIMTESDDQRQTGMAGMGRWLAVGSELPCSVIVMTYLGTFLGTAWWGPQGAIAGGVLGSLVGFVLGVLSVYKTVQYYDRLETQTKIRRTYMPPAEEIYEEFDLPGRDEAS
jgi:F0F1-type ATP synthase assembly protein I